MRRLIAMLVGTVAAALMGWCASARAVEAPAMPATPAFVDVTAEAGLDQIVQAHYALVPKWWLSGITLVDLSGAGHLDLHLAGHGSIAAAARNDGHGHFTAIDPQLAVARGVRADADLPYPGGEIRLAHDFNEDGRIDLLCAWHDGGGVLYDNACRPGAAWSFTRSHALDHFNRSAALADVDGDGKVDYLADADVGRAGEPQMVVWFGAGDGTFARKQTLPGFLRESAPIPVDLDGDGKLDFLLGQRGYNPPGRRILRGEGGLRFTDITRDAGLDPEGGSIHGVGDLNGDGFPDLICIEGEQIVIYLNDGRGHFRKGAPIAGLDQPGAPRPHSANWGGAVVVDLDNDGLPDILIDGRNFFAVLHAVAPGQFQWMNQAWGLPSGAWSAVDEGLCFGDVDGDGRLDLVVCNGDGDRKSVRLFRNQLPARNWLRVRPVGAPGNRAATGAKIRLYAPGTRTLLAYEQVAIWGRQSFHSYYTAAQTERHFGLGERTAVDVSVEFHPSGKVVERAGVRANTVVEVREQAAPLPPPPGNR